MRVLLDGPRCTGHARCNAVAPQVYVLDDEGYNALSGIALSEQIIPPGDEQAARDGAASCPERALTIIE